MDKKNHRSLSENERLEKVFRSLEANKKANAVSLSDMVRPDLKKGLSHQLSSENGDDFFDYPSGSNPTSLSDMVRPDLKKGLPHQLSSENGDDFFDYPSGSNPTSLSDMVRPDIIGFQGESNSTTDNDWEEVVFNVTSGESHFDVENSFPGCISEATVGLVKNSQSNEGDCPDLFIEKVAQADLLQENPINSSKSLYSTHLPNNVMTDNRISVCDVAPPTSPIIKMDKGSNAPLRIALDFCAPSGSM